MKLYNTMTRRKEEFVPVTAGKVGFYICGPTVYNHIHIGNARTFLSFDVIRRYLEWSGYEVTYVQNITDVDDKIINRANEEGRSPAELAEEYTAAFIAVMRALGVVDPTIRPKATEEIPSMIQLIIRLIDKGHAYEIDGDVYFSVRSFPDYGKLSGRGVNSAQSGARVDIDPRKRDPLDFALWKTAKPGEPFWPSPWGEGRPGWHIECSAMSARYLGNPFDIHAGGDDLTFPHHENEVAQSEACFDTAFANYWLHGGMLTIDREKMSKSEGNFLLLKDVLEYVRPAALRLLMLQTHYRSPFDYSAERLDEATAALERIEASVRNLRWAAMRWATVSGATVSGAATSGAATRRTAGQALDYESSQSSRLEGDPNASSSLVNLPLVDLSSAALVPSDLSSVASPSPTLPPVLSAALPSPDLPSVAIELLRFQTRAAREHFKTSMDDDFNTAGAVAGIYELVSAGNLSIAEGVTSAEHARIVCEAADTIVELISVLGVTLQDDTSDEDTLPEGLVALAAKLAGYSGDASSEALEALLKTRQEARVAKNWALADAIRNGLASFNITIEDTPQGPRVIRT